jgi:CheY-like chemotaxis protein
MQSSNYIYNDQSYLKFILIVEDDLADGEMLQSVLRRETPYFVSLVASGTEALQVLDDIVPDLILLDYALPDMSGLDVYKHCIVEPAFANMSAVLVTAWSQRADVLASHLPCLAKPYNLDTMFQVLHQQLASH